MTPELQLQIAAEKAESLRKASAERDEVIRRAPERGRRWHWRYHVELRTECASAEYQNAKALLEKLKAALGGLGSFRNVPNPKGTIPHKRAVWDYRLTGFAGVQAVVACLWPWLSAEKRAQAVGVLRGFRDFAPRDVTEVALRAKSRVLNV